VLALHRRPNIQRLTKLQLLGRIFGGNSLASLDLNVGDVVLLRGPRERAPALLANNLLIVLGDVEHEAPRYGKAMLALSIFLTVLVVGSLDLVPLSVAGLVGMLLMIATRCVDARLAFRVDWRVALLIGSMLSLGLAMETSGAGMFLGQKVAGLASSLGGPRSVMLVLMLLTILLSAPMSNQAAALVVLPVAINAASQLGVDPRPFVIAVTLAASCSFITPLEPSCVMVYGPGHYRFTDFFRLGTPLTAVLVALLMVGVPLVWPFDGPGAKGAKPQPAPVTLLQRAR
jgi:di/tricarboxylate transporter